MVMQQRGTLFLLLLLVAAVRADNWDVDTTMYLLTALFSTAFVCFFVAGVIFHVKKRQNEAVAQSRLSFPDAEEDPSQFWSSTINDVHEPMRHFYPASKLATDGSTADKFSGY